MKSVLILIFTLTLFLGCSSRVHPVKVYKPKPIQTVKQQQIIQQKKKKPKVVKKRKTARKYKRPIPPKKVHKPKVVQDKNYSEKYMYPEDGKAAKKDPTIKKESPLAQAKIMTKQECIRMITQEKFDKYTTMFGSEAASLKRCTMLKAMKK